MHKEYADKAKSTVTQTIVKVLKIIGTALAIINGFIQPLSALVYGKLTDELMIPPSGNTSLSASNHTTNTTTNNTSLALLPNTGVRSTGLNNSGIPQQNNLPNNLNIYNQNATTSLPGNTTGHKIPTRLVLTPDTNPLYPPGYGYPVMPGLARLHPQKAKEKKAKKKNGPSPADKERKISKYAMYYCYLALATFVCSYGQMMFWTIASSKYLQEKQTNSYVKLEEEEENGEGNSEKGKEEEDSSLGSRITIIIQNVANFASSMLVSFIQNWQLTLMMLAAGPILASVMFYMNKIKTFFIDKVKFLLQKAKGVAKGAVSQVQTVAAFGGQDFEKSKFSSKLLAADKAAKIRSIVDAIRAGLMIVIAFVFLGIGFWFSAGLILDGTLSPGAFISIFMAIISSVLKLVNVGDSVNVGKDEKKDDTSMLGENSNGENKPPENDVIGKILEQLSSPEEMFQCYPKRPEYMVKSGAKKQDEDSFHVEFSTKDERHRGNMTENNVFGNTVKGDRCQCPSSLSNEKNDTKSCPQKLKEKFQSKRNMKNEMGNTSEHGSHVKPKFSFESVKERLKNCFQNTKSWFETKVFSEVKKRGMSLEVIKLQIKQLPLIVLSVVGAVMTGMIAPGFSLLLSEILIVTADPKRLQEERVKWALKFVDLGVFIAIGSIVQKFATSLSESRMEMGMKENAFNSVMDESEVPKTTDKTQPEIVPSQEGEKIAEQNIEGKKRDEDDVTSEERFNTKAKKSELPFDGSDEDIDDKNVTKSDKQEVNLLDGCDNAQADNMTDKMDVDASKSSKSGSFSLSNLTTKVSSSMSKSMTMLIAFTNGWKMTLVVLAGQCIITYAQSVQNGEPDEANKAEEKEDGIVSKLWKKLRGVTSSASEKLLTNNKYKEDCMKPYRYVVNLLIASGLAFAIAECVTFLVYGGALRYGGYLVRVGEMTVESVMTVLMTVLFGESGSSNAPTEKSKTKENAEEKQLDDVTVQHDSKEEPVKLNDVKGEVTFHEVEFHHPEKKRILMSGLNISVKSSETLAIIGTTDFNNNSVIALVERFYDPNAGYIALDNIDVRSLDVRWLRSQIAIVSETAVLPHHSVLDNLLMSENHSDLNNEDIDKVLNEMHLNNAISSLPKSYESLVMDDVVLDNATKQKLVMARALIRNPRVLIIDEFPHSDEEAAECLRRLCVGRTCIIFARNFSTIEKADKIAIVCHGKVVEQGCREELMKNRGLFYHLLNTKLQSDIAPEL